MKKRVFLFGVLIIFTLTISLMITADLNVSDSSGNQSKVDKAYDCLEAKVKDKCSSLSSEEKIFSLLAIGECKDEVLADSKNDECWPKSNCDLKTTAQAILALDKVNVNTEKAETWLLSQNATPQEIDWYLEIDSPEKTNCTINYEGLSTPAKIIIGTDKKINSNAGSCLTRTPDNYWLIISQSCYDKEFEISCDKQFLTTLLFKKKTSSTIHVLEKTSSASAGGTTSEKVDSSCFAKGGLCNYEASLWAALVLNFKEYDISPYLPYLITMTETEYLPESFLYFLTGYPDLRNNLLLKQKSSKWWMESNDKFYDTALALYPFQYEEPQEKTNSINWLLDVGVQDKEGCWGGIRNTAFLLYSIWPRDFSVNYFDEGIDCEDAGYYCMSSISCQNAGGDELKDYTGCFGANICCNKEKLLETCKEMNGEICNSAQTICNGGNLAEASDLKSGETCCVEGVCEEPKEKSECELNAGNCRPYGCNNDEEESSYSCDSGDTCCIKKTTSEKKSYWWIWLLLILIVLAVLGIIFKERLRPLWFKIKSKFGKSKPGFRGGRPGFPPASSGFPQMRAMPRRIFPPEQRQPIRKISPQNKLRPEVNDVLKKLKEMSK